MGLNLQPNLYIKITFDAQEVVLIKRGAKQTLNFIKYLKSKTSDVHIELYFN